MILFDLFKKKPHADAAAALYETAVAAARRPAFYESLGVADTVEGRFDMVVLHVYLILRRLKGEARGADLAQALFDALFADMDANLRQMGAGDITIGGKVKAMVEAFYGRAAAYDAGLAASEAGLLMEALDRNLYRKVKAAPDALAAMAGYLRGEAAALTAVGLDDLLLGRARFGPPPVLEGNTP